MRTAQWIYDHLENSRATTLLEGLLCNDLVDLGLHDADWVEGVETAWGDDYHSNYHHHYVAIYLFFNQLVEARFDVARWLMVSFADTDKLRKIAAANFSHCVTGANYARKYTMAFSLTWPDFEPIHRWALYAIIRNGKCDLPLMAWLIEELRCPIVTFRLALDAVERDHAGAHGDIFRSVKTWLRIRGHAL